VQRHYVTSTVLATTGGPIARWHDRDSASTAALGGGSFEDADVCCMDRPASSEPDAAQAWLRQVLKDMRAYLGSLGGPAGRMTGTGRWWSCSRNCPRWMATR
jgi:hypothetical protein